MKKIMAKNAFSFLAGIVLAAAAQAQVVVVVGSGNPAASLTADQVSNIFLGKARSFPGSDVTATPLDQPEGVAVRDTFYSKVIGKDSAQIKAYWSRIVFTGKGTAPKEAANSDEVKKQVSASPNLIGYIEQSAVDSSVKVVFTAP